jgi:hypothetical protein
VEADGSARFEVPANRLLYFQALDAQGRAVQTMRSGTYLQPGAQVTCLGCHEPKNQAPSSSDRVLALNQPVRTPKVGPTGSNPVFYPTLVQPLVERQCVSCHAKARQETSSSNKVPPDFSPIPCGSDGKKLNELPKNLYPGAVPIPLWTVSYAQLVKYAGRSFAGRPQRYEGRTTPGSFGTLNSKLYPLLTDGKHHGLKISPEEMERLMIWMDLNCNFRGHYLFIEEQSRGILPALPPFDYFDISDHPEARIPITPQRKVN